jgi:hypothetical protein
MNVVEQEILAKLLELEGAVVQMKGGVKTNLLPIFSRIEELTAALPRGADPQLLHYLHKKSYEKARLQLQGKDAENARGTC